MKTILVIDDDEGILDATAICLEQEGFAVIPSTTGTMLYSLSPPYPDLILLDILLSGQDGRELCHYLKSNPNTAHIPIVLFSAHSPDTLRSDKTSSLADGFIAKPFELKDLTTTVRKFL